MIKNIAKVLIVATPESVDFRVETYTIKKQTQKCLFSARNRFIIEDIGVIGKFIFDNSPSHITLTCVCLPENIENSKMQLLEAARKQSDAFTLSANKTNNTLNNYKL